MRFLSLFSGSGGLDLGLHRAGWECVGQCEADPWRRTILARHWPDIPQWDDVQTLNPEGIECDLIAGGFPCQDVSVAGRRKGLAGERTGLFWHAIRIVESVRPRFVLLENVPGLLTSNGGRDFGVVLGALADLGYGVGWRVVDSRFFGVPQRRRRVFIVGTVPGGRAGAERAGAVLSVGSRCERHPAAGGETREGVAASLTSGSHGVGVNAQGRRKEDDVNLVAGTLSRRYGKGINTTADDGALVAGVVNSLDRQAGGPDDNSAQAGHLIAHTLRSEGFDASEDVTGRGTPLTVFNPTRTLMADGGVDETWQEKTGAANALFSSRFENKLPAVVGQGVRRLTPVECCRLQGFPDDWYGTPNEKPDGPKYAALGDAVTVNVAEWLGHRLAEAA